MHLFTQKTLKVSVIFYCGAQVMSVGSINTVQIGNLCNYINNYSEIQMTGRAQCRSFFFCFSIPFTHHRIQGEHTIIRCGMTLLDPINFCLSTVENTKACLLRLNLFYRGLRSLMFDEWWWLVLNNYCHNLSPSTFYKCTANSNLFLFCIPSLGLETYCVFYTLKISFHNNVKFSINSSYQIPFNIPFFVF